MKEKKYIELIFAILLLFVILNLTSVGCPIHFFSGINCPGCGMTRAYLSLLHGNILSAFYLHPLFLIIPLWIFIYFIFNKKHPNYVNVFTKITVVLLLMVYIIRLLSPECTIITINLNEGFFFRIIKKIMHIF